MSKTIKTSEIAYDVYTELENKFVDADIPEETKDELYEKLNDLVKEIDRMVEFTEIDIDQVLYEHSAQYVEDTIDDMRTQEYLERSLF